MVTINGTEFLVHRVITCLEVSGNLTAVRDFTENEGIVKEKILSGKSCLKLLYCKLHNVKYMVSDHALLHSYPHY